MADSYSPTIPPSSSIAPSPNQQLPQGPSDTLQPAINPEQIQGRLEQGIQQQQIQQNDQIQQIQIQQQQQLQQLSTLTQTLHNFWTGAIQEINDTNDFKTHALPLARIKKVMKTDEDVKMISAEAPVLFEKAIELFILELTHRAWVQVDENKRRTLQKNDISAAISRTDLYDFLIDIVPREDMKLKLASSGGSSSSSVNSSSETAVRDTYPELQQFYQHLAQHQPNFPYLGPPPTGDNSSTTTENTTDNNEEHDDEFETEAPNAPTSTEMAST